MAKGKYGFSGSPAKDCIVPRPSAHSGAGEFKNVVEGAPSPSPMPIKPVQFADVKANAPKSGIGKK